MTTHPLDPAAIMVDHRANEIENCGPDLFCLECDVEHPCEPYRLAAELEKSRYRERELAAEVATLRGQVQRVRDLANRWEHGALRWADPLPVPPQVAQVRVALDDPTETDA